MSSSASGVFQLLGWCTGRPFSLANSLSGSSGRPALSGAQNTATTFSLRSSSFSSTALPKASWPCTTIRLTMPPLGSRLPTARLGLVLLLCLLLFLGRRGARLRQRRNLIGRVAEFGQDLPGMLAEQRGPLHVRR